MLNEPAVRTMIERLRYDPLQFQVHHMSAEAAMRVWRVANEQERRRLLPIVAVKLTRLAKTDAAKARLLAEELRPALPARN
jgi:hypothetical protein